MIINNLTRIEIEKRRVQGKSTLREEKALKLYELERQCSDYLKNVFTKDSEITLMLTTKLEHDALQYLKTNEATVFLQESAEINSLSIDDFVDKVLEDRDYIIEEFDKVRAHYNKYKDIIRKEKDIQSVYQLQFEQL